MKIDILTLFPETVNAVLHESIIGRAAAKGIVEINCVQIRDYTENKQRQVDDYPYGGGWGCVMMAQPLKKCLDSVARGDGDRRRVIYLSPQGETFTQNKARQLLRDYDHLVLVCGHYEGVDERFIELCVDEELSIGDFVLTGGEIAAMAVADCVCRMVPGVLSDEECFTGESHWEGLLEYPQYTRPEVWEGLEVPEVLRNGNHEQIRRWRRKKMFERTMDKRPELFESFTPNSEDGALIEEIKRDRSRLALTKPVTCRAAEEADIDEIMLTVRQARNYLKKHRIDQWQGEYPAETDILADIGLGRCFVMQHGEDFAGFFVLGDDPEEYFGTLTDGKWRGDEPYCVLHRCAVRAEYRGTGMADRMLREACALCLKKGVHNLRSDTHRKNRPMSALLRRCGFEFRGNLTLTRDDGHDPRRQGFEKILR